MRLGPSLRRPVCAAADHGGVGQGARSTLASILLAEDDQAVRALLARVLRSRGYQVIEADNGATALALAEATPFDLLITDVMMPKLNGPALVALLRRQGHTLPVIYITGYTDVTLPADTDTVLRKPFSPASLVGVVAQALAPS
jgi:two-component system cell cycle sensor histidine kinase/response regulator CckA